MLVRNFPIDIHKMKEERAIFLSKVQATRKKCNEELIELQEKHSKNCRDVSYDENYLVYITEKYANRKHEILNLISNLETYEKRVNCVYNYYINLYRGNYIEKEMYEKTLINLLYKELFEFSPIKIVNNILRYKNETINIKKDDTRVLQTA